MRVVLDGQPLTAPGAGISHYTYHLVRALARADAASSYVLLDARVIFPRRERVQVEFLEPNIHVVPSRWWGAVVRKVARRLGRRATVEADLGPFDVYHATNYLFTHRVARARRVVTIHDMTLARFPEWHPKERLQRMVPELANGVRMADRVVADSHSTKQDIVDYFELPPERIVVVPLAADASFLPLDRAVVEPVIGRWGLRYGDYLLFMGTLEPRKNLGRLLDAVEMAGTDVGALVIAGATGWSSDDLRARIHTFARRGRVRYLGYVPDSLRPALMNGARGFVYPSLYEGFGLPALEAMACGTPLLASNVSSLPEVVGDAALMIDPYDIDALAEAVRMLWHDDALRAELRQRGLRQASRFSWSVTARDTLRVYHEVVGG